MNIKKKIFLVITVFSVVGICALLGGSKEAGLLGAILATGFFLIDEINKNPKVT